MSQQFWRVVPKTSGASEKTLRPQTHGVAVLVIVEGAFDATDIEANPPIEPPASVERLIRQLARITPFQVALAESSLSLYWTAAGNLDDAVGPRSDSPPNVEPQHTNALTPDWALARLVGAEIDDLGPVLTGRRRLPYAPTDVDVLTVVMSESLAGSGPFHSVDVGPVPYVVMIPPPPMTLSGAGIEAQAVAKGIGKVLGLGEESTDPSLLAAPDFWGRAFPNLWVPPVDATTPPPPQPPPPPPPPWFDTFATVADGGFGLTTGVQRPSAHCLMGDVETAERGFCEVCADYLKAQLIGREAHVELEPAVSSAGGSILGSSSIVGDVLWESITPQRLVPDGSSWQVVAGETTSGDDGLSIRTSFPDGTAVITSIEDHRSSLGRTVVLTMTIDASCALTGTDLGSGATMADDAEKVTGSATGDDGVTAGAVAVHTLDWFAFARWIFTGAFVGAGEVDAWYRSQARLQEFDRAVRSAWMTHPSTYRAAELVLTSHNWWFVDDPQMAGTPTAGDGEATADLTATPTAYGFSAPLPGDTDEPDPRPWMGRAAVVVNGRTASRARLWPAPLQGEAADLLPRVLAGTHQAFETADADALIVLHDLAFIQCVGVPERGPFVRTSGARWYRGVGRLYVQLVTRTNDPSPASLQLLFHADDVPTQLTRLVELLDVEPAPGTNAPTPIESLLAARAATAVAPSTSAAAAALKSAVGCLIHHPGSDLVLGDAFIRCVALLTDAAVSGRTGELVAAYPGDLFGDLLSIPAHISRRSRWARLRALTRGHAPTAFSLGSRATVIGYDTAAMQRQIQGFSRTDLTELATVAGGHTVWSNLVTWFDGWGGNTTEFADALAAAEVMMQIATQVGRGDDTGDSYSAYFDGAAALWAGAANAFISTRSAAPHLAAARVLVHTPPELRAAIVAEVTPPSGAGVLFARAGAADETILAAALQMVISATVPSAAVDDALSVIAAAGDLLGARSTAVAHWSAQVQHLDATNGSPADVAHAQQALDAATAANQLAVDTLRTPFEASIRAFDVAASASNLAGFRAAALTRFGLDAGAEPAHRLSQITVRTSLLDEFHRLPHETMVAVNAVAAFRTHLSTFSPDATPSVDAAIRLKGDGPDSQTDLRVLAVDAADALSRQYVNAVGWPELLDDGLARVAHTLARLDDPASVATDNTYLAAKNSLVGFVSGDSLDKLTNPGNVDSSTTVSDDEPTTGYAAAVRLASVLPERGQQLPIRIRYPKTYCEYLRLWLGGITEVIEGEPMDGHAAMRAALAYETDPSLFAGVAGGSVPAFVRRHRAVVDLVETSIATEKFNRDAAEEIYDVLYSNPSLETLKGATSNLIRNIELAHYEGRLESIRLARSLRGVYYLDAVSNAGPEFDEGITRFEIELGRIRHNTPPGVIASISQLQYAVAVEAFTEARRRATEHVQARRDIAKFASGLAAAAAGIGISLLPLGQPLGVMIVMGALGAGAASAATRYLIEGPEYTTQNELDGAFAAGAIEGMIDAAVGGAISAGGAMRSLEKGAVFLKGTRADAIAAGAVAQLRDAGATLAVHRVARTVATGALEGAVSGAVGGLGQSALDQATWDQSFLNVFARLLREALSGGLFGTAMGTAFALPAGLVDVLGQARAGEVFSWLLDRGRADIAEQLDGVPRVEQPPNAAWRAHVLLGEADELRRDGFVDEARAKLDEIDPSLFDDPISLTELLLGDVDLIRGNLRGALDEIAARSALLSFADADLIRYIEPRTVPADQLPPRLRGGAHLRIESLDPPRFTLISDESIDLPRLREEILHVAEILRSPTSRAHAARLLAGELDDLWTPTGSGWSPWSDGRTMERLEALRSYYELEAINQQQMIDSYGREGATSVLTVSDDGVVTTDLDEDALLSLLTVDDHRVADIYQRAAIEEAIANPDRWDDPLLRLRVGLDDAPHLTGMASPRAQSRRVLLASGVGSLDRVDQAFAAASPSVFGFADAVDTSLIGPNPISSPWRRRYRLASAETVQLVQVGGCKRFMLSEVNRTRLVDEGRYVDGQLDDRPAFYQDLPNWAQHRLTMRAALVEGFQATMPQGTGLQPGDLADLLVDEMGREPFGFVYGTAPLRAFGYDIAYRRVATGTTIVDGVAVPRAFAAHLPNGQRHHLRALFLLSRHHLDVRQVGSVDMTFSMVDLPYETHRVLHEEMSRFTLEPHLASTIPMTPAAMLKTTLDGATGYNPARPALAMLREGGGIDWALLGDDVATIGNRYHPMPLAPAPLP
jgi:hypothetical protein